MLQRATISRNRRPNRKLNPSRLLKTSLEWGGLRPLFINLRCRRVNESTNQSAVKPAHSKLLRDGPLVEVFKESSAD
jgi:hypothetical protein